MNKISLILLLLIGAPIAVFAQAPTPTPVSEDDVVKISTNLIQIDVTAVDKNGRQVTDLKPEEIEIYENGQKQEITNFSYVSVAPETGKTENAASKPEAKNNKLPPAPIKLRAEQVRRTIALVADDMSVSFAGIKVIKQAMRRFVNELMLPNDLVAVIYTSGGTGALQTFTSDKRLLLMAIEKIKFRSGRVYAFPARTPLSESMSGRRNPSTNSELLETSFDAEAYQKSVFAIGTLGAVRFLVSGMNELPGRKAIVLFSEGFSLKPDVLNSDNSGARLDTSSLQSNASDTRKAMRALTESANRAGVIINTIDTRGLEVISMGAGDDYSDVVGVDASGFSLAGAARAQTEDQRRSELYQTQSSLRYLAEETGGHALVNNNGFFDGVQKAVNDLNGYYLLGYQPDDEFFDPNKNRFNKLEVKVRRPGVNVSYRSGFFGVADNTVRAADKTRGQNILSTMFSPFGSKDIEINLASIVHNDAKQGNVVRALMHIRASDLKFTSEPNNQKKADFEVYAYTFGESGKIVDTLSKGFSITVENGTYQKMLEKGLVYSMDVPLEKPGAYQLRIALRDKNTGKIGSGNQFIEVPNVKNNKLALSGIILQNFTQEQWKARTQNNAASGQGSSTALIAQTVTATRKFTQGDILNYGYVIYNARADAAGGGNVQTQIRLYRDGKLIFENQPEMVNFNNQTDLKRIEKFGALVLGKELTAGDYILQTVVFDNLAKEKNQTASNWIDFEIVR